MSETSEDNIQEFETEITLLQVYYNAKVKFDGNKFPFLSELPEGFRLANINDFHVKREKKIGMHYLIKWADRDDYYEVRTVDENTTAAYLIRFIDDNRVFIKD